MCKLSQDVVDDVSVDIGEPEVAALIAVGEPLVFDSHEVEESRVEVVHMHRFFDDIGVRNRCREKTNFIRIEERENAKVKERTR